MGIDHGLGGKDSAKNKLKRASKAHRNKALAQSDIATGRRNEVIFDDEARTRWLTGFRNRKQTRRKFGLAMQVLKEKRSKQQLRKEIRKSVDHFEEPEEEKVEESKDVQHTGKQIVFSDADTNRMFGGEVSVVVDEGIAEVLEDFHHPDRVENSQNKQRTRKPLSALDKALKSAEGKMQKKHFKQGGKDRYKKRSGTKLLHKALGSGALGKNSFKGSAKKR